MITKRWVLGQVAVWVLGAAVLRAVVVPAESCPPVTPAAARGAVAAGAAWLARDQRPDGTFVYGYHRRARRVSTDYNVTRHAGVMDGLYRAGRRDAADGGLRYVLDNLARQGRFAAFVDPYGVASAGANALLVVALVHRRERTRDGRYDELLHRLGEFLRVQTRADGSVLLLWDRSTGKPVPGQFGKYATGETFYALALLGNAFPGEGWTASARRVAAYLATRRDRAEDASIRQADHWAAYGLATLGRRGLTAVEADYARFLAGYFGFEVRFEAQHTGRSLGLVSGSGAELGTTGEGVTALARLAGDGGELSDLRDALSERSDCVAGIIVDRQVSASDPDPRARGAWFADGYTQMDDQQHAIAALIGYLGARR